MALIMNEVLRCPNCKNNQFEKREYVSIEIDSLTRAKKVIQKRTGYFCSECNFRVADLKDVTE